jgi:dTDP-4-amino-4,6-dideoxygalactose transaminase
VNYKLAAPLAAIGLRRLARLDAQIAARAARASIIIGSLPADDPLSELALEDGDRPNYHCLVLRSGPADASRIASELTRRGLGPDTIRWRYQGLNHRPLFAQWPSPCPHADALIAATFQLPVHPGLSPAALRYISEAVRSASQQESQ